MGDEVSKSTWFENLCGRVRRIGRADALVDGKHLYLERHGMTCFHLRDVRGNLIETAKAPEEFAKKLGMAESRDSERGEHDG